MKTKVKSIASFEAKTHLASLIDNVQNGDEYIITEKGKPVAKLIPFKNLESITQIEEILFQFDSIRKNIKDKVDIIKYVNEGRKY